MIEMYLVEKIDLEHWTEGVSLGFYEHFGVILRAGYSQFTQQKCFIKGLHRCCILWLRIHTRATSAGSYVIPLSIRF